MGGAGARMPPCFPAGLTAASSLASRNLTYVCLSPAARLGCRIGLVLLTAGTAWARVKAKKHYPSDVLAGMALGHFLGAFMNDAFLGWTPTPFKWPWPRPATVVMSAFTGLFEISGKVFALKNGEVKSQKSGARLGRDLNQKAKGSGSR